MFEQLENLISKYVYDGALPNNNPQMNRVEIDGWGSQKTLSHLSLKQIQNLNPDADEISIKRVDRKDVESARGKSYKNCGFRIVLTVPIGRQVFLNESSYQIYPQSSNSSVLKFVDRKSPEYLINNLNRSNSKELFFVDVMTESKVYLKFGKDLKLIQSVKKYLQKSSDELLLALKYNHNPTFALRLSRFAPKDFMPKFLFLAEEIDFIEGVNIEPWSRLNVDRSYINRAIVKENLNSIPFCEFQVLENGLRKAVPTNHNVRTAPSGIFSLDDVFLQAGGTLVSQDYLHVVDSAADPRHERVSGQSDQSDHIFGSTTFAEHVLVKAAKANSEKFGEAILLGNRNDYNYYHWMIESLPRAIELDSVIEGNVPFFVSSRVPKSGIEALKLLSNRKIILIEAEHRTHFELLHVALPSASIIDTAITHLGNTFRIDFDSIFQLRNKLVSEVGDPLFSPQIYLARKSNRRRLVNQDEIISDAAKFGFDTVYTENLTFLQQLNLFHHAEFITGPTGAVMANYIFMNDRAKILGLTPEQNASHALPALLSSISGAQFFTLKGIDKGVSKIATENLHNNFKIDRSEFRSALSQLLPAK